MKLEDMDHPGYDVRDQIDAFMSDAACADYMTEEGQELREAFEQFEEMAYHEPSNIRNAWNGTIGHLRCACYALIANCTWQSSYDRNDVIRAIAAKMKKEDIVRAMAFFGSCVNEYYRLQYVVQMYGGWSMPE